MCERSRFFALGERGAASSQILEAMTKDEHELVRETAQYLKARTAAGNTDTHPELSTVEKMIALRSAPIFSNLEPEGLAELAWASREDYLPPGAELCAEGEPGAEVFILLRGEVEVLANDGAGERVVNTEPGREDSLANSRCLILLPARQNCGPA